MRGLLLSRHPACFMGTLGNWIKTVMAGLGLGPGLGWSGLNAIVSFVMLSGLIIVMIIKYFPGLTSLNILPGIVRVHF